MIKLKFFSSPYLFYTVCNGTGHYAEYPTCAKIDYVLEILTKAGFEIDSYSYRDSFSWECAEVHYVNVATDDLTKLADIIKTEITSNTYILKSPRKIKRGIK